MAELSPSFRILAIDPAPSILALYERLLTEAGYRISSHSFADRDLDRIVALSPDAIVLDGPWDRYGQGWEFLAALKADAVTRSIPLLICTFARREVARRAEDLRAMQVGTLSKPFERAGLLAAVADLLPVSGHV